MTRFRPRIETLAEAAADEREGFTPPPSDARAERAVRYCREGVGPTVAVYLEARTGGRRVRFPPEEFDLLGRTLDDWLALYARCYGVEGEYGATVRSAAEILLETHSAHDVARVLTGVPDRADGR
ncbi:hypothetical protein ACFO0N_03780 [Halobium salinum]|uniref:DUF8055 domain-containing protein n=1 Tax=Halobium salinum TaxID=1364940 RepID=A0ABD5P858_9EURY|nr:hypothetical protein [Halobium salinum]